MELLDAMTIPELENFKAMYKSNAEVVAIVDGKIEAKREQELKEQAKQEFLASLPKPTQPPDDIVNIYARWTMQYRPLTKAEKKELRETHSKMTDAELDTKQVEVGMGWSAWEFNKGFQVVGTTSKSKVSTRKPKLVYRKEASGELTKLNSPEPIFTWTDWCEYLNNHPELLHTNDKGEAIKVIETSASGLVDLKTAGFIGIEGS